MVLVYLPTKLGDFGQGRMLVNIPHMEHMAIVKFLTFFIGEFMGDLLGYLMGYLMG